MPDIRKWKSERELLLADEFGGRFSLSCAAVADNSLSVWIAPGGADEMVVLRKVVAKASYSGGGVLTIDADGEVMWEQDLAASGSEKEFDFGELGAAGGVGAGVTVRASAATSMSSGRLWVLGQRKWEFHMSGTPYASLSAVQQYLGLSSATDDDLLTELVVRASDGIRAYCGREVAVADYHELHDGDGSDVVLLNQRPVAQVFALSQDDAAIAADDFAVYPEAGMVRLRSGVFGRGARNVYVAYRAGYESLPGDVEQAAIEWAAALYQLREAGGREITSERVGDYAVTYDGADAGVPGGVRSALEPYRIALARPVR